MTFGRICGLILLGVFASATFGGMHAAAVSSSLAAPSNLQCESQSGPLAIQTLQPRFSWLLAPVKPGARSITQSGYRILVASSRFLLAQNRADVWDSGVLHSAQFFQISYAGKSLDSGKTYFWKVMVWDQNDRASAWSRPAQWSMGLLQAEDWRAAWIAATPDGDLAPAQMPVFRYVFPVWKPVRRAVVYIAGLGQYELRIDGAKVGRSELNPGWTDYRKTVFYNAYDVTSQLQHGKNALGVLLGNGMYNVIKTPGRYTKFTGSFGQPKLILQLQIEYIDGSTQTIGSGTTWKTAPGPITFSSAYGGEDEDARILRSGWDRAGFKDSAWKNALAVTGPGGTLTAQENPPVRVQYVFHPVAVHEPKPGILVYDLGQNFSGWPQIRVEGPVGSTLRLIPGELLDAHGFVTQASSGGPQWFAYTLRGNGREVWHPRFSYYGFRYMQVEGASTPQLPDAHLPKVLALEGQFLYSSSSQTGSFATSDVLLQRIHVLIDAAIRSNMQSVLTDCPHREKLGWLEETHLLGAALMDNFNLERQYEKIANDIHDAQHADGMVPEIAPEYVRFPAPFNDSPEWGSAVVLDPWIVYRHYGDQRNLALHYSDMQRYVDYLGARAHGHLISYGLGDWYDIGPQRSGYSQLTSQTLTATAMYYQDLATMVRIAGVLGRDEDAARYDRLAAEVRDAFNAALWYPTSGNYDRNSQTASAMPLVVGLVAPENRQHVLDNLVADIRAHRNHVTAGDVGFHYVVDALLDGGRSDVLYDMMSRTDPPSYGAQLKQGATSLTEAWDANPHSSQDHFMLGDGEEWFYRGLAGIDLDMARSRDEWIVIRPNPVGSIAWTRCTEHSVLGDIVDNWSRRRGKFLLDVTVPANASATIYVPSKAGAKIEESGHPADRATGVTRISTDNDGAIFRITSGKYHFVSHMQSPPFAH